MGIWDYASAGEVGKIYFKSDVGYSFARGHAKAASQLYKDENGSYGSSGDMIFGKSDTKSSFNGTSLSAGFGYNIYEKLRTSLTFTYNFPQSKRVEFQAGTFRELDGDLGRPIATSWNEPNSFIIHESTILTVDLYYDFDNISDITPFVNIGIGYGWTKNFIEFYRNHYTHYGHWSSNLAWNIGAGASYQIADRKYIDLSYKLTCLKSESTAYERWRMEQGRDAATVKVTTPKLSQSINLGFRFEF